MSVKGHYDHHLGNFYSWMLGDFQEIQKVQENYLLEKKLYPSQSGVAIDLGAGNGIQTISLAHLGYKVIAVDFNHQLLKELAEHVLAESLDVVIKNHDLRDLHLFSAYSPELILCCGDTITHLASRQEVKQLIMDAYHILSSKGKLLLSFRDYGEALQGGARFIPVKQDTHRMLTCFLEYSADKVRVTDILHEKENDRWIQKVSAYEKVRLTSKTVKMMMEETGFVLTEEDEIRGMHYLIVQKP